MAGERQSHIDVRRGEARRVSLRQLIYHMDIVYIPLFSMAWIRLTRAGGAVSGGVNCSLRSRTETAEITTQITVSLLALSLPKSTRGHRTDKGTVNWEQLFAATCAH